MLHPMDQSPEHDIVPQEELETVFRRIQAIAGLEPGSLNPTTVQKTETMLNEHEILSVSTAIDYVEASRIDILPPGVYDECSASIITKSTDSPLGLYKAIMISRDINGRYYSSYTPNFPYDEPWEIVVSRVQGTELYLEYAETRRDVFMNLGLSALLSDNHNAEQPLSSEGIRAMEAASLAQEVYDSVTTSDINRAQLFAFQQAFEHLT